MTQCFFYSASEFIHKLDKLHRDINQTTSLIQEPSPGNMINMLRLRAAMDLCIEQLPTLLKIEQDGAVSVTQRPPPTCAFSTACLVGLFRDWQLCWSGWTNFRVHGLYLAKGTHINNGNRTEWGCSSPVCKGVPPFLKLKQNIPRVFS